MDAREAKAQWYLRKMEEARKTGREYRGMTSAWTAGDGRVGRRLPQSESFLHKEEREEMVEVTPSAPPRIRRSREARLDAMIQRLKDLPPQVLDAKLKEIQGEFFKLGAPVAYEDLKRVAAHYLNRRGVDNNYTPDIRGNRGQRK